jgi:hypothetical protein
MDDGQQEEIALYRWAVIAEAANDRLTAAERGALVRQIAARAHTHPDGSPRRGGIPEGVRQARKIKTSSCTIRCHGSPRARAAWPRRTARNPLAGAAQAWARRHRAGSPGHR